MITTSSTDENLEDIEGRYQYFRCKLCRAEFDSFGDMQRHIMTKHVQSGDIFDMNFRQ